MKNLPYRPCVGIMLLNDKGKVFVAHRIDTMSEAWQMPQGGIDDGENPVDTAFRELLEEIGTNDIKILAESKAWYSYDLPDELIPKVWNGKYRGQKQKWFVAKFLGKNSDININTDHPEFKEWKWILPEQLPDVIVPFKKELYKSLLVEFNKLL